MGLFRNLGRRVERFKAEAETAAEERAAYECEECGARFDGRRDGCPDCGGDVVPSGQSAES